MTMQMTYHSEAYADQISEVLRPENLKLYQWLWKGAGCIRSGSLYKEN